MKVLLIGNYPPDGQESMLRFGALLCRELNSEHCSVDYLQPRPRLLRFLIQRNSLPTRWCKYVAYVDKMLLFPLELLLRVHRYDLVHILDHSNAIYGIWIRGLPWLLTCNDLLAVRAARGEFRDLIIRWPGRTLQKWIACSIRRASAIVCISDETKRDVQRIIRPDLAKRLTVIPMGLNHPYQSVKRSDSEALRNAVLMRAGLVVDSRFVFHVGGDPWYKNREGVVRMFDAIAGANPDIQLLMVGKPASEDLDELVRTLRFCDRIGFAGNAANEEMEACYQEAEFLLFPSIAEGFGWPIVEAQACGCRVATTNRPPMTEVGGDACVYLNLDDINETQNKLQALLCESGQDRADRVDRGLKNAARYSPALMGRKYLELYEELARTR